MRQANVSISDSVARLGKKRSAAASHLVVLKLVGKSCIPPAALIRPNESVTVNVVSLGLASEV
eukprot:4049817-Prymnesium_polylepis.1